METISGKGDHFRYRTLNRFWGLGSLWGKKAFWSITSMHLVWYQFEVITYLSSESSSSSSSIGSSASRFGACSSLARLACSAVPPRPPFSLVRSLWARCSFSSRSLRKSRVLMSSMVSWPVCLEIELNYQAIFLLLFLITVFIIIAIIMKNRTDFTFTIVKPSFYVYLAIQFDNE